MLDLPASRQPNRGGHVMTTAVTQAQQIIALARRLCRQDPVNSDIWLKLKLKSNKF